jgi:hypothetical protein
MDYLIPSLPCGHLSQERITKRKRVRLPLGEVPLGEGGTKVNLPELSYMT